MAGCGEVEVDERDRATVAEHGVVRARVVVAEDLTAEPGSELSGGVRVSGARCGCWWW